MSWRAITEDDIVASLSAAELDAYKASANWEADPVEILLRRAAAIARDAIRTNGAVEMSPDEMELPEGCISPAIDYVVYDIVKRIGGAATEERKQAREEAIRYFERIEAGTKRPEAYGEDQTGNKRKVAEVILAQSPRMDSRGL